jgi:uncharacterized protein
MADESRTILVDRMLGRLATWLRLLGEDAPLVEAPPAHLTQGQVLLTRRRAWRGRPGVVFIQHDQVTDQLAQAKDALGLALDPDRLFTRCLRCNLKVEPLTREEAAGLVPDYTAATAPSFTRCPGCGRVYWPGSHGHRALATLEQIFG